jgi:hypothetical protein
VIFAPFAKIDPADAPVETAVFDSVRAIIDFLEELQLPEPIPRRAFAELVATIEGANGLPRPKPREPENVAPDSKGNLIYSLETEIASFDKRQKHGYIVVDPRSWTDFSRA